ncbi:MAG: N-6 DNA methylase [Acidobacteria bacterium]|nr:N-6 DNA methylase [Acidobacteriota bacterium]
MAKDPAILAHQEWLGYVQPVGLVVSIPAMLEASLRVNQNIAPDHRKFLEALPSNAEGDPIGEIDDFPHFAQEVLGWAPSDLCGAPDSDPVPVSFEVALPEYNETLRPSYALRDFDPNSDDPGWILLVKSVPKGTRFDDPEDVDARHWQASPQAKFERLLRQTRVPIGLLVNGEEIRLVYAPEKELSGYATFKLSEMVTVAGRPIFAAFHMLLNSERLYSVGKKERLPAILENSRKYQNVVSTQLANQVLEALYELLRGFQAADDQAQGLLLRDVLSVDPDRVYRGLLTTLLRTVFILYAEDRGLLSTDEVFTQYYSITGLYERLRIDDGRYPDTMDQRFGAWAQLLTLFRLIYRGGSHGGLRIPAREGYLFDPDRYLFLEGRSGPNDLISIPRVPDGVLFRVLSKLMLLDGERISYRTLAVEQIGSVYEAIMGFELHVASGPSIAIKPVKRHGAPTTINLEELLRTAPEKRGKWFTDQTDQKLTGQAAEALKSATDINGLMTALDRKIASAVTPGIVAKSAMIFQPSDERRRSGSHYTPSSLTGPIVQAALEPVLEQLGGNPTPEQILALKVCDPAMGSGAFLVEACRQLGDALVRAWHAHNQAPILPPDEDESLHAQRQIAQRCLYGVDKNPMAADLAKLSLWLATLAKDHPFTFLDHALRSGDSLVGLSRKQITAFHWDKTDAQQSFLEDTVRARLRRIGQYRQRILDARDLIPYAQLEQHLEAVDQDLGWLRRIGDTVIAAFFSAEKPKAREAVRQGLRDLTENSVRSVVDLVSNAKIEEAVRKLYTGSKGIRPFHWELEFPEVFRLDENGEPQGGFDSIIGNPPFQGGKKISTSFGDGYRDWLATVHSGANSSADLAAHFFRRSFDLLAQGGTFGLIATNTIAQGDTRSTGLRWICQNGGTVYRANKRLKWPGEAAVIVSVVHVSRGVPPGPFLLNGKETEKITAYLFHAGGNEDPAILESNAEKSFVGSYILGMGFTFDDTDTKRTASSIADMEALIARDGRNGERIFPYLGGEELNGSPTHSHYRYVINFEDFPLERKTSGHSWFDLREETQRQQIREGIVAPDYPGPVAADWPDLLSIVKQKVKPERDLVKRDALRERWWQYADKRPGLTRALKKLRTAFCISRVSPWHAFGRIDAKTVAADSTVVVVDESYSTFAVLQSRPHEIWSRFMASSMKDDLRYTPSDCFETFPFPRGYEASPSLEEMGKAYFSLRAELMVQNDEGLTKTYNRFHDPNEDSSEFRRLRELHDVMDRAVLNAYGWDDILPVCEFFPEFDDEEDEDENGRPKRKNYRYRWPDAIHDEVLARLLELNRQRAEEERPEAELQRLSWEDGATGAAAKPKRGRSKNGAKNDTIAEKPTLFNAEEQEV